MSDNNTEIVNAEDGQAVEFDGGKKEAVKQTIAEIKSENSPPPRKKRNTRDIAFTVVACVFFPVTLIVLGLRKLFKKLKLGITAKTTVVFTVVFGLMLIGYAAFVLASISNLVGSGDGISASYMHRLVVTSSVLVAVFIVLGAVLGGFSSQYMIDPVRKITKRVKEISDENISARLDPVDSQDEFMELTKQINYMLDSLQQAFERQENFVSDASHELKTPLSVIAGYSNLLRRWGKDDPKVLDESVEAIARESENMKRIVDQLLWLAKIGKFTLNNSTFNLYETVSDVVDGYKLVNTKHDISLSGDASVTLNADKNLLTEAVRTLVDNAIKYTPPQSGIIKLNISQTEGHAELTVSDNGIGISEEDQAHIFERFYRCDKVRGRESGSSGLGLTICKSIIEMMGGEITVESKLGEGSTFKIVLNRFEE
ncbi:MAG: HAMP domain-containing histidine kinase [Clostridiales bacterium]|nr:HAMP domain-containing histidine kinase [Clostridiales bacterium]